MSPEESRGKEMKGLHLLALALLALGKALILAAHKPKISRSHRRGESMRRELARDIEMYEIGKFGIAHASRRVQFNYHGGRITSERSATSALACKARGCARSHGSAVQPYSRAIFMQWHST